MPMAKSRRQMTNKPSRGEGAMGMCLIDVCSSRSRTYLVHWRAQVVHVYAKREFQAARQNIYPGVISVQQVTRQPRKGSPPAAGGGGGGGVQRPAVPGICRGSWAESVLLRLASVLRCRPSGSGPLSAVLRRLYRRLPGSGPHLAVLRRIVKGLASPSVQLTTWCPRCRCCCR